MKTLDCLLIGIIRIYRLLFSPMKRVLFGPLAECRFTPSCSAYGIEAIHQHGAVKGAWLLLRRLLRCHPWGGCGCDPVPLRQHPPLTHCS